MEMIKLTDLFAKIRDAVNDREASLKKNYLKRVEDTFEYFQKDKSTINKAFDQLDQLYDRINVLTIAFNHAQDAAVVGMSNQINEIDDKFAEI